MTQKREKFNFLVVTWEGWTSKVDGLECQNDRYLKTCYNYTVMTQPEMIGVRYNEHSGFTIAIFEK